MIEQKTIDLLVRAGVKGEKDLEAVAKSITKIEDAIDRQSAAAKRGESSLDELKGSLEALKQVQAELVSQKTLIDQFTKTADAVSKAEGALTKANAKYSEYLAKLGDVSKASQKENERLDNYSKRVEQANKAVANQTALRADLAKRLADAGIAVDRLADAERANLALQAELALVYRKNGDAIKSYADDVRAARDAEKKANAERADAAAKEAQRQSVINAQAAAEAKRAADMAANAARVEAARIALRNKQVAESQKQAAEAAKVAASNNKRDTGLKQAADDAEAAARGYTTLSRAATSLAPKAVSLRDAINAIVNPGQEARSTIGGLESQVTSLAATISKIKGPVADYRAQFESLNAAQKAVASQAGLIDNFRRQTDALRLARTEFIQARAQVAQYAEEVRKGGESGAGFVKALAEAQNRAKSASQALLEQLNAARQSRDALRAAGIAANDLASAEARLTNTAKTATGAVAGLTAAMEKYGQSSKKAAADGGGPFGDSGRTTLSLIQRIRGEVLALTAAYVGLFGVINLGKDAVKANSDREGLRNQLSIAVGNDKAAIDAEYNYIKGQSDRIGTEFERTAKGYAKFSAAAALAGRSRQEIRYIFETFAEVGRVANLSADDLDGVFKALEQITSKGKIQAEELRGQLGDRLFGAFQIAAKALKDQFPDLDKALEKGVVTSDQLVKIAQEYRKTVAEQLPAATASLAAQQARYNNALLDFKLVIGDSGFIDSFAKALAEVTAFLKSDDGKKFAEGIGQGFKGAADSVIFLMKNLEAVKTVITAIGVYFGTTFALSIISGTGAIVAKIGVMFTAFTEGVAVVKTFAAAWPILTTAVLTSLAWIGVGFASWAIGDWAYKKFGEVRQAGTWMVTGVLEGVAYLKGSFEIAFSALIPITQNVVASMLDIVAKFVRGGLSLFSSFASAAGMDGLAKSIDGIADSLKVGYFDISAATASARAKMAQEVANIRAIRKDMLNDDLLNPNATLKRGTVQDVRRVDNALAPAVATTMPAFKPGKKPIDEKEAEAAAKKRQTLIDEVTRSLEALNAKIDRSQTDSLDAQLKAIDLTYAELSRKVEKIGGDTGKAFMTKLTEAVTQLKGQTTAKFNDALLKDQDGVQKKLESMEASAGKKSKSDLVLRLDAIDAAYESHYRELAALREKFVANGRDPSELDSTKIRMDAAKGDLKAVETEKFKREELIRLEQQMQNLLGERDARLKTIAAQEEAGLITNEQARAQAEQTVQALQPQIAAMAEVAMQFANSLGAAFDPTKVATFIAQMQLAIASGGMLNKTFQITGKQINDSLANGATNAIDKVAQSIGAAVVGTESWSNVLGTVRNAFLTFAADFLREIAMMIIKQQILTALQSFGIGGSIGTALSAMVKHDGGMVGTTSGRSRGVSASWFANAPKYHTGGIAGLSPDEYPAILQRNEEVLAADSPRNVMNGGGMQPAAAAAGGGVRFVLVDDRARVPEAMAGSEGDRVIVQSIRKNAATIKQMLK